MCVRRGIEVVGVYQCVRSVQACNIDNNDNNGFQDRLLHCTAQSLLSQHLGH